MRFTIRTVHARGQYLETPTEAPDALTAARSVLRDVARSGAVVRLTVDPGDCQPAILALQQGRALPTHSRCLVTFASGRSIGLTFRGAPAAALERVEETLGTVWADQGGVTALSASPLTERQYSAQDRAVSFRAVAP